LLQPAQANTHIKNYEDYAKYLRLIGKDYSIVPEFRISEHIAEYLNGEDFTTLTNIEDIFSLTGSDHANSSSPGFFREYSNSDFMKMFDLVNDVYDGAELIDGSKMHQDKIGLRCSALLQFLPYKGFYPAERTLELASLFSQSFGPQVFKSGSGPAAAAVYRAILEPLYSQGVMYNTIKSGIAVSNFIISNTASIPATITPPWGGPPSSNISASAKKNISVTALPEGNLFFEYMLPAFITNDGSKSSSYGNENGYFFQKVPFEALYQPRNYLSENYIDYTGRIYDTGLHSASLLEYATASGHTSEENYVTWDGQGDKRYDLAIDNFLCETINFFQNGLTSIVSSREDNFGSVESGSVYTMKLKLYRPVTTSTGHDWAPTGSIIPDYDKFDMYRRVSAFGPPLAAHPWSGWPTPASASYGSSFSHVTPPYMAGSGSCDFTYTASDNGVPTLDDIFGNISITYDRMEFVKLQAGPNPSVADSLKVQLNDSFNLTQSISSVPAGTRTQKKQWLIQSKFETPIINIAGDRRTCLSGASPGAVATGSAKFLGRAQNSGVLYFTGSSGTAYQFIADTGSNRAADGFNTTWYFNTGSSAATAATHLYNAITASNFVVVDTGIVNMPDSITVMLTASIIGTTGNFDLVNHGLGDVIVLGMSGGIDAIAGTQFGDVYGNIPEATPADTTVPIPPLAGDLKVTENCQIYTQGLWHDYGSVPSGSDEGVFAIIESPSPREGKSLAELVGMPIGQPFRIGAVKARNVLEEAVVAVPFFVGKDNRRKFYKLDSKSQASKDSLIKHLDKYIFPPRFDFVRNRGMDAIAMYVFEFSRSINQKDIADMWQNLPPSIHETFQQRVSVIEHKLLRDQMLNKENRKLRQDLRWLVFKVKKRAETDYTRFIKKGLIEDISTIPSNTREAKYSYNWPYDYFSLVELVKIDEAIEYTSALPPDSRIEIVGDVNIRTPNGITIDTEGA